MANTTPGPSQIEVQLELIRTQLLAGVNVCGVTNTDKRYQTACHLIGIASYVKELALEIKHGMEVDKIHSP